MPLSEDIRNVAAVLEGVRRDDKVVGGSLLYDLTNVMTSLSARAVEMERRVEELEVALCGDRQAELRLGRNSRLHVVSPAPSKRNLTLVINNDEVAS